MVPIFTGVNHTLGYGKCHMHLESMGLSSHIWNNAFNIIDPHKWKRKNVTPNTNGQGR